MPMVDAAEPSAIQPSAMSRSVTALHVARDLLVRGEPYVALRLHVDDQLLEAGGARAVAGNVRVHRQDEEAALVVGGVELRAEHLLDQIRIGQAAVGRAAEVREVVEDALDRQLDD